MMTHRIRIVLCLCFALLMGWGRAVAMDSVVMRAPFYLVQRLIIVQAQVNGQWGNFIFDTGAPGLVLNHGKPGAEAPGFEAALAGINGLQGGANTTVHAFEWQGRRWVDQPAIAMDLSSLEEKYKLSLMGLIGREILGKSVLVLDYATGTLELLSGQEQMEQRFGVSDKALPLELNAHLPCIRLTNGKKSYLFGVDSGASVNVVDDSRKGRQLFASFSDKQLLLAGIGQQGSPALEGTLQPLMLGEIQLPLQTALMADLSAVQNMLEHPIDGILGFEFLKQHRVALDFKAAQFHVWNKPTAQR